MAIRGLRIASLSFAFLGFNVFAAGYFAALNNGFIGGLLSTLRTVVFNLGLLLTLPRIWDLTGVWSATPIAESFALLVSIFFLVKMGKKYHYLG